MNETRVEILNTVAARWAEIIWTVSWQFCVLGLCVYLLHLALYRAAPNWRYWVWQILAIKLLLMPFWTATAPWKWPARATLPPPVAKTSEPSKTASAQSKAQPVVKPFATTSTAAKLRELVQRSSAVQGSESQIPEVIPEESIAPEPRPPRKPVIPSSVQKSLKTAVTKNRPGQSPSSPTFADQQHSKDAQEAVAANGAPATRPLTAIANKEDPAAHSVAATSQKAATPTPIPASAPAVVTPTKLSMQVWLLLAWLAGMAWMVSRIVYQGWSLSRHLKTAQPAEPAILERVRAAAQELGLSKIPEVLVVDLDVSPFVCGLRRARLILPQELTESFTPQQLNMVLLHELAHVRRRDLLWGWISEIARICFFFHPLVYFLQYQIRLERELACDQLALQSSGRDVATYADTLVRVAGQFSHPDAFRLATVDSGPN